MKKSTGMGPYLDELDKVKKPWVQATQEEPPNVSWSTSVVDQCWSQE